VVVLIGDLIETLKTDGRFRPRVEHMEILPDREPLYGTLKGELPQPLQAYLDRKKIRLYSHQCEAIEHLRSGKNVVITTPTASGKTLAFNLPVFEALHEDVSATALFVYPTKALSNDQLKVVREMERLSGASIRPAIYDGDTPLSRRTAIRDAARIIITNPYELHQILPWHQKWQTFLKNLRFLVIDEAHTYRGVFGSNVAFVIRRLRRLCRFFGSEPQFVLSTATLANPLELAGRLTGLPFELVDRDGSPRGKKYFVFYNPFFDGVGTLSTHQETRDLFILFMKEALQTLCFAASRRMAELIARWAKETARETAPALAGRIASYRAGYLPEERREIEDNLKRRVLAGVTSTNALELGIDVGTLDGVIMSGYPGTIMSTWQQAGRAGRGRTESVAALVAFQNPLDQYLMKHPAIFFGKPHEHAVIDLANPYILSGQVLCAAAEMPVLTEEDRAYFGDTLEGVLEILSEEKLVRKTAHGWVYAGRGRATEAVGLDQISEEVFRIVCDGSILETMDRGQAFREAHTGAVLLHQGETYTVQGMDLKNHVIQARRADVDYYTRSLKIVDLAVLEEMERRRLGRFEAHFGKLEVTEQFIGYKVLKNEKTIATENLDLPPLVFRTTGLWFTVPEDIRMAVIEKNMHFGGGLHGIEHAMIGVMPLEVMCDRWDVGGLSTPGHPDTMQPTIFIYDGFEGGIGLTEKAYALIPELMRLTLELVRDCPCAVGCPACVYSPKCGNDNKPLDKKAAAFILEGLLDRMR